MESHTPRVGVMVHDTFPPFPNQKKKKIYGTSIMHVEKGSDLNTFADLHDQ